ncbi:hypothetical protein CEXT_529491 [Caerostris extrusa]|uniref:Uncharacterized protein n=1 Tax=Caerostris extrusa TaxID=172846 RepID=A0AAV4Y4L3_CAEEX|nr:hypothetical protein CEXT_529491 [Caerostris extrusa]
MFFIPSLQHMEYSKIAVTLCNQADMKAPFNELKEWRGHLLYPTKLLYTIFAEKGKQKVSVLKIPEKLKPDLIFVLKSTVLLIYRWFMDHSDVLEPDFDDVSSIQWRSEGTIDIVKTAQALARREDAPLKMRLKFAISYCLEQDVLRLRRSLFYALNSNLVRLGCLVNTAWIRDWCKYTGIHDCGSIESLEIASGSQQPSLSTQRSIEGQLECMSQSLVSVSERKKDSHRNRQKNLTNVCAMRFCLPRMDERDLEVVFTPRFAAIFFLESFLDWPLFNLLLPMTNRLWRFMVKQDLERLLRPLTIRRTQHGRPAFYL